MSSADSRTFLLDSGIVDRLASPDMAEKIEAFEQLPSALSRQEIDDLGVQVNLSTGPEALQAGDALERQVVFLLGRHSIRHTGDLVTAQSAAHQLWRCGDMTGTLLLRRQIHKAKRRIIETIMAVDS